MKTETQIKELAKKEYPMDIPFHSVIKTCRWAFIKGYTACQNEMQENVDMLKRYLRHLNEAYGDEWTLAEQGRFEDAINNKDPFQNQPPKH